MLEEQSIQQFQRINDSCTGAVFTNSGNKIKKIVTNPWPFVDAKVGITLHHGFYSLVQNEHLLPATVTVRFFCCQPPKIAARKSNALLETTNQVYYEILKVLARAKQIKRSSNL
jgi:hypothetical protein